MLEFLLLNPDVIISCYNNENTEKIKTLASRNLSNNNVKPLPTLNPRLRVAGIDASTTEDIFSDYIVRQNPCLFNGAHTVRDTEFRASFFCHFL
jgi:hypothetical protein